MSILTSFTGYRPNFCCECGNKIVRLRWLVWTSRRFCDKCSRAFARSHWLRPSLSLLALLVFGVLIGRGSRSVPPPLIIERPVSVPAAAQNSTAVASASTAQVQSSVATANTLATVNEEIYTCGARTKKGTPCSRRVHGPVRCWQHKGMPAMLPQEKLRIKD